MSSSSLRLNLTHNALFAAPEGYPFRINPQTEMSATAVIPKWATTVYATYRADKQADVHLGVFAAPLTVGGPDSSPILQVDALASLNNTQTLTLAIPVTSDLVPTNISPAGGIVLTNGSQTVTTADGAAHFPLDGSWNGYEISIKNGTWYSIASVQTGLSLTIANPSASVITSQGNYFVRRPAPVSLVAVLWIDNIVGGTVETVLRDASISVASTQPQTPGGILVSAMGVT